MAYYDDGIDFETLKAEILLGKIAEALTGKKAKKRKKLYGNKPDIEKFEKVYGKKIKRPKE